MKMECIIIPLFILFACWLAISCTYVENYYYTTPKEVSFDGLDREMFEVINKHRKQLGLVELKGAKNLTEMAEEHVVWMIDNEISHYGYTDRQLEANSLSFAEVICTHKHTAENYLLSYLGSQSHKKAIEKTDVTHIGIYTNESGLQCILLAGY